MGRKKKTPPTIVTRQVCLECSRAVHDASNFQCSESRDEFWNNPQGYAEVKKKGGTLPGEICPKFKV